MYYLSQLYELKNPKGVARKKADALIKNDSVFTTNYYSIICN